MKKQTLKLLSFIALSAIAIQAKAQFTTSGDNIIANIGLNQLTFRMDNTVRSIRGNTSNYMEIYSNGNSGNGPSIIMNSNFSTVGDPGSIALWSSTINTSLKALEVLHHPNSTTWNSLFTVHNSGNVDAQGNITSNNGNIEAQGNITSNTGTLQAPFAHISDFALIDGALAIGNTGYPAGYKLYVEKGILTEKLRVANSSDPINWADFVFDENYNLMSIPKLEKFIKKNKHLPEIPTTEDVQKNGIDIAEINAKLLQKVEELTLYIIQQQKEIDAIKKNLAHQ